MLTKIIPKINLVDFIKLVWAVIIIYFGLSLSVFDVGEGVWDLFNNDYLTQENHDIYFFDSLDSHQVVYSSWYFQANFDSLCAANKIICKKLAFKSQYELPNKTYYLSGSVYVVWWINEYMVLGRNIIKSFDIMNIQEEDSGKRAWTRWNKVFINTNSISYDGEFSQLLWHEFGHIIDLYSIRWFGSKKDKNFTEFDKSVFTIDDPSIEFYKISWNGEKVRKSKSKPEDFCSGYGMYDIFEDFAECNNLYLNHNAIFKLFAKSNSVLKNKYNFIASIYAGKYFDKNAKMFAFVKKKTSTRRPWDTTKIKNQ